MTTRRPNNTRGKATIKTAGDVTTVRVITQRGNNKMGADVGAVDIPLLDLDSLKVTDIVEFNRAAELQFIKLLDGLCDIYPSGVSVRGLRAETAYRLGVSTETAKRYVEKYCVAFSAPYELRGGSVVRKDNQTTK